MCPNITSFKVRGNSLSHKKTGSHDLQLRIEITEKGKKYNEKDLLAKIYVADITHFFSAEDYLENNYMEAITLSEELLDYKPYEQDHINKFI